MRNAVGEGPAATTMVETRPAPNIILPKITLIWGAEYEILSQGTNLLSDHTHTIYRSQERIKGIAIHIAKRLIFVSDAAKYVRK